MVDIARVRLEGLKMREDMLEVFKFENDVLILRSGPSSRLQRF